MRTARNGLPASVFPENYNPGVFKPRVNPDKHVHFRPHYHLPSEKYDIVGRLLKPGETPNKYSDDESEDKKSQ